MTSQGACTRNISSIYLRNRLGYNAIAAISTDYFQDGGFKQGISFINRPTHMCIFTLIYKHWIRALSERAECLNEGALANMTTRGSKKAYLAHVWQQLHLPKHKPFRSMHKIVNVTVYFQKCKICPLKMKSKTF